MKTTKPVMRVILFMILVCISVCLWNCQNDDYFLEDTTNIIEQSPRRTEILSFDKLPIKLMTPINQLEKTVKSVNRNSEDLLVINYSQIIQTIDSLSNSKFSIRFSLPNQPQNVIYNLILGTDSQNVETSPFVLKYTINNPEEVYENG